MPPDPSEYLEGSVVLLDRERFAALCQATRAVRDWGDLTGLQTFWDQHRGTWDPVTINWFDDELPDGAEPSLGTLVGACGDGLDVTSTYAGLLPDGPYLHFALLPLSAGPVFYRWMQCGLSSYVQVPGKLVKVDDVLRLPATLPEDVETGLANWFEIDAHPLKMKNECSKIKAERARARRLAIPVLERWRVAYPEWRSLILAELEPLAGTDAMLAVM